MEEIEGPEDFRAYDKAKAKRESSAPFEEAVLRIRKDGFER